MKSTAARNVGAILAITAIAWFGVLSWISTRTHYPFVFSDEAGYFLPMLLGYSDETYRQWSIVPAYPAYLYFQFGSWLPFSDLHTGAKLLNAFFVAATAMPTYWVARRYLDLKLAAMFAVIVIISPVASFVRFVMPEPVYFFGFWMLVFVVLTTVERSPLAVALIGGALIGMLSLIKPHAFALTLGLGGFFLLRGLARRSRASFIAAFVQFGAYFAVRVMLGYQLTGKWLWSPTGKTYDGMLTGHTIDFPATIHNLFGHLSALGTLIAVPLAITVVFVIREWNSGALGSGDNTRSRRLWDLGLLACCLLTTMLLMTVYFSQSVYQQNPEFEKIVRLHGRYYFYVLPLFPLLLLGLHHMGRNLQELISDRLLLCLCMACVLAAVSVGMLFEVGPVDFPDLTFFYKSGGLVAPIGVLFAMAAILIYGRKNPDSSVSRLATVAWWGGLSTLTSFAMLFAAPLTGHFQPTPIDSEFAASASLEGPRGLVGRDDGIVFGTSTSMFDIYRVMFYLHSRSTGKMVPVGSMLTESDFPDKVHWAILLPGTGYTGPAQVSTYGPISVVWRK